MKDQVKILHIDPDYRVTYLFFSGDSAIRSEISLEKAIELLKTEEFDIIISEPNKLAILSDTSDPKTFQ